MIEIPLKNHSETLKIYISTENYDILRQYLNKLKKNFDLYGDYTYIITEYIEIIYKETVTKILVKFHINDNSFRQDLLDVICCKIINTNLTKELHKDICFSLNENKFDSFFNEMVDKATDHVLEELSEYFETN